MIIVNNLKAILSELPAGIKLVCVSKNHSLNDILLIYNNGHKIFGENKVQELLDKHELLPKDIEWHFIGHLQTNKVKYIVPFVSLIHSVDSFTLLSEINRQAVKNGRIIDCLLQFHISEEETKYGLSFEEACEMLKFPSWHEIKNIRIKGVMGMATFTDNETRVSKEFKALHEIFIALKTGFFRDADEFKEISMGMSDDYRLAFKEGSTIVRIGTGIFGQRV